MGKKGKKAPSWDAFWKNLQALPAFSLAGQRKFYWHRKRGKRRLRGTLFGKICKHFLHFLWQGKGSFIGTEKGEKGAFVGRFLEKFASTSCIFFGRAKEVLLAQ